LHPRIIGLSGVSICQLFFQVDKFGSMPKDSLNCCFGQPWQFAVDTAAAATLSDNPGQPLPYLIAELATTRVAPAKPIRKSRQMLWQEPSTMEKHPSQFADCPQSANHHCHITFPMASTPFPSKISTKYSPAGSPVRGSSVIWPCTGISRNTFPNVFRSTNRWPGL